jgi:RNA polymerase sigma factor (sigma-70 family)
VNESEIVSLCKSLAGRYRNQNHYDDLVSVGVLCCYELKEEGCEDKDTYTSSVRRAMNDYINIKVKTVNTPSTWASRRASKAVSSGSDIGSLTGVAKGTFVSLMAAMADVTEGLGEDTAFTKDHAATFEDQEYHSHVIAVAEKTLGTTEMLIIKMRYLDDMTQDMVAEVMGTNQRWVSRHETSALSKLRQALL